MQWLLLFAIGMTLVYFIGTLADGGLGGALIRRAEQGGAFATVARKEVLDIFRDRRAVLVTLITAIVAGPIMMLLVLNLVARQAVGAWH